jgi:hypothetical protein
MKIFSRTAGRVHAVLLLLLSAEAVFLDEFAGYNAQFSSTNGTTIQFLYALLLFYKIITPT